MSVPRAGRRFGADDSKADLIRVPNTLRSKLVDKSDGQRVQLMIDHGWSTLQEQKVVSASAAIVRTIKRVLASYQSAGSLDGCGMISIGWSC